MLLLCFVAVALRFATSLAAFETPTPRDELKLLPPEPEIRRRRSANVSAPDTISRRRALNIANPNNVQVIPHPRVSLVYYGARWDAYNRQQIYDFVSGLGASDWWQLSTLYTGSSGTSVGASIAIDGIYEMRDYIYSQPVDFYNSVGYNITSVTALADYIVINGLLPSTSPHQDHLILILGDDYTMTVGSCAKHCGWHSQSRHTWGLTNYYVSWIGNPRFCTYGYGNVCGENAIYAPNDGGIWGAAIDAMISVVAHEITEWATDPTGYSWWDRDTGRENGDMCAYSYGPMFYIPCKVKYANTMVSGRPFTIQQNVNLLTNQCAMSLTTQTPRPSCTPTATRSVSVSRSLSHTSTSSRSTTATNTATVSHTPGVSDSMTASMTPTLTGTASSSPSITPSATCYFTPAQLPAVPSQYGAFNPRALLGVCLSCGGWSVQQVFDPSPTLDYFLPNPQAADNSWALDIYGKPPLGLAAGFARGPLPALSAGDTGLTHRYSGNRRRLQQQQGGSSSSYALPTCYPVSGSSTVPLLHGDGYTLPCLLAPLDPSNPNNIPSYFVTTVTWDQAADAVMLPLYDYRVLRGGAPAAIARISQHVYAVGRHEQVDAYSGALSDVGGVTLVLHNPRRNGWFDSSTSTYAGSLLPQGDVRGMALYAPTPGDPLQADSGLFFAIATRANGAANPAAVAVYFASLNALITQATAAPLGFQSLRRMLQQEYFMDAGLVQRAFSLAPQKPVAALATIPGQSSLLLSFVYSPPPPDPTPSSSYLLLLTRTSQPGGGSGGGGGGGDMFTAASDSSGALGWGVQNPVQVPSGAFANSNVVSLAALPSVYFPGGALTASGCVRWRAAVVTHGIHTGSAPNGGDNANTTVEVYTFTGGDASSAGSWAPVTGLSALYDFVLPAPRPHWSPSASPSVVPPGHTPPASSTPLGTPAPSYTPTMTIFASTSPTSRPWNATKPWTYTNILVLRVGPAAPGGAVTTNPNLSLPVYLDEFAPGKPGAAPVSTLSMPLVNDIDSSANEGFDDALETLPPSASVCTLPGSGGGGGGGCVGGHGQTALDGSELVFTCIAATQLSPPSVAAAADRVLVTVDSSRVVLSSVLEDPTLAAGSPPSSWCSTTSWGRAGYLTTRVVVGDDGARLVDVGPDLRGTLSQLPLQHSVLVAGLGATSFPGLALTPGVVQLFASSTQVYYGAVDGTLQLVPLSGVTAGSIRDFAVVVEPLPSSPSSQQASASLFLCDTAVGILGWSTTWTPSAGGSTALSSSWASVGPAVPINGGGCEGLLGRKEGVNTLLYVTSHGTVSNKLYRYLAPRPGVSGSGGGAPQLLATSPPGSTFRGVFNPPTPPPSATSTPSATHSHTRPASRSSTRKHKKQ